MKKAVYIFVALSLLFNFFTIFNYFFALHALMAITGRGTSAIVALVVESPAHSIIIAHPQNTTYSFGAVSKNYTLPLNVSSDFGATVWRYTLQDLIHNTTVNYSITFTPNSTIDAVRWNNLLTVFGNDSGGTTGNASVRFYISVPNTAPTMSNLNSPLYACEGNLFTYDFTANDTDEDDLTFGLSPVDPFFVTRVSESMSNGLTSATGRIYTGTLRKANVGVYHETASVSDNGNPSYSDSKQTNITVIEINNLPTVDTIGVQTIWTKGANQTLLSQINVSDIESSNQSSGNFTFNLTFLTGQKFFDINQSGFFNVSGNSSIVGVYNISLCVADQGLKNISQNISLCGQDGLNRTNCQNFSLTVTNSNRVPTIDSYYQTNLTFAVVDTSTSDFNVSTNDLDGTVPDIYWFADGVQVKYQTGTSIGTLSYSFGCGVSGNHIVKVNVTDGELAANVQWNITVTNVACTPASAGSSAGGGGGGGGAAIGGVKCDVQWACQPWNICNADAEKALTSNSISSSGYSDLKSSCDENNWDVLSCGFQNRSCFDTHTCNASVGKPPIVQACYFTQNPSCHDSIKNCHDGGCEFLIDCGGPCSPCATCSDGIQNQGEAGIDCGSPCPRACPVVEKNAFPWYLLLILFAILILIGILVWRRRRWRRRRIYERFRKI